MNKDTQQNHFYTFQTNFIERVKCKCGHIFRIIKLRSETLICCPVCKEWTKIKDIEKEGNE
jgi:hypothetical protein